MTTELFIVLFTAGSAVNSLLTEAEKKTFKNQPPNELAFWNAIMLGIGGTLFLYPSLEIPFTLANVLITPLMALCIWIGSMVGYDKVVQTISQLRR